ncbi:succinate dehydrogenase, cytochrome b556 subunit [Aquabacterium sp. J223]|uniref:succinate dehydrogenase, cytochrome b556 subunit n=1 Tax=Aquabacterium sp. J223 TaxID=2898431 RepID=UPI0021AD6981|nr:succinate dehydrogenase, cytochrome b556 subunit [Aquabacterium sp. J223]UUX94646.1 succinate dehydrogenase, cytochrome b556 subunit [Aquabacterium sp. J223]
MADTIAPTVKDRRVYTNIHISQIVHYRLPPAGWVSILHRISGAVLFLLLPLVIWLFDTSVSTEVSYERFRAVFVTGIGILPGWLLKLMVLGLIWGYLMHFVAGVRHLWMDVTHGLSKEKGRVTAIATLLVAHIVTLLLAAKLFGLY